jgi:glycosyltransferase involved in cell wall biosynthesis
MNVAPMKVVHAVRSDAFAGVERYIAAVAPRLAARGVDVRVIGSDALGRVLPPDLPFRPAATTWDVAAGLRSARADIVHVHMTAAEFAAALVTRRSAIVCTRHFTGRRGKSAGGHVAAELVRRRLAAQISISDAVATSIGEPSTRIYHGVDRRDAGTHDEQSVLVLQRLEAEKDTHVALRAWAATRVRGIGWSLGIAGAGSQRAELEQLAAALGVHESVRFLGHVSDVETRLARAGMLLATAPCEPFGLSVVEAMAAATPVIAAAGGGHLETVGAVEEARLFPAGDAEACAALIDELAADVDARHRYGQALQRSQRARFDLDHHVDSLIELYARVA